MNGGSASNSKVGTSIKEINFKLSKCSDAEKLMIRSIVKNNDTNRNARILIKSLVNKIFIQIKDENLYTSLINKFKLDKKLVKLMVIDKRIEGGSDGAEFKIKLLLHGYLDVYDPEIKDHEKNIRKIMVDGLLNVVKI